jgi:hypothetical protein
MEIPAHILKQAMELYLQIAYPAQGTGGGRAASLPPAVKSRMEQVEALPEQNAVPLTLLEKDEGLAPGTHVLRLGQPLYPFMKLAIEPVPEDLRCREQDFLLRVDSHDRHLHAPAGSPDAAWLATVRQSNRELGAKIETAWAEAGLPTFKEFLRGQVQQRRAQQTHPPESIG